ncbi:hypothetical protein NEFER03_1215 [Nematocida sp. LUAm3]|nr:hypothetical protein NEFER03_1215 [Nematocida sp. LUAm3]KAI5175824.1 hypothetical protein NEFER02_1693 [Nematocida sp. LUAm2]KAI5178320.1 hypothetical protein NEFER01_1487 [Nematocida sp. LUAm1]
MLLNFANNKIIYGIVIGLVAICLIVYICYSMASSSKKEVKIKENKLAHEVAKHTNSSEEYNNTATPSSPQNNSIDEKETLAVDEEEETNEEEYTESTDDDSSTDKTEELSTNSFGLLNSTSIKSKKKNNSGIGNYIYESRPVTFLRKNVLCPIKNKMVGILFVKKSSLKAIKEPTPKTDEITANPEMGDVQPKDENQNLSSPPPPPSIAQIEQNSDSKVIIERKKKNSIGLQNEDSPLDQKGNNEGGNSDINNPDNSMKKGYISSIKSYIFESRPVSFLRTNIINPSLNLLFWRSTKKNQIEGAIPPTQPAVVLNPNGDASINNNNKIDNNNNSGDQQPNEGNTQQPNGGNMQQSNATNV